MPGHKQLPCPWCKGARRLCGLDQCLLIKSFIAKVKTVHGIESLNVEGSTPPSIVVGERGYPHIRLYYGIPPGVHGEDAKIFDDPHRWFKLRLSLNNVFEYRSRLIYAYILVDARDPWKVYENEIGLTAVSQRPVDSEAILKERPIPRLVFDTYNPPRGPSATAVRIRVSGSPKLHRRLEKLIWDDVRASDAVWILYNEGLSFYDIVRAFSIGLVGLKSRRRLVPTRWSITAVDSVLAEKMLSRIRKSDTINDTLIYYGEFMYNKYLVALAPGAYRGLWIEIWRPHSLWNPMDEDRFLIIEESHSGRVSYIDGGYMAARFSIIEHLYKLGRQARFAIVREVGPQYIFPVGNWQIRETIRHILSHDPILRNPTISELEEFVGTRFRLPRTLMKRLINFVYYFKEASLDKWISGVIT